MIPSRNFERDAKNAHDDDSPTRDSRDSHPRQPYLIDRVTVMGGGWTNSDLLRRHPWLLIIRAPRMALDDGMPGFYFSPAGPVPAHFPCAICDLYPPLPSSSSVGFNQRAAGKGTGNREFIVMIIVIPPRISHHPSGAASHARLVSREPGREGNGQYIVNPRPAGQRRQRGDQHVLL